MSQCMQKRHSYYRLGRHPILGRYPRFRRRHRCNRNLFLLAMILLILPSSILLVSTTKIGNNSIPVNSKPGFEYASVTTTQSSDDQAIISQRDIQYLSGDFAWFKRYSFKTTNLEDFAEDILIPGTSGTVRWYDTERKQWQIRPLEGELPDALLFIDTDNHHMILSQPYVYEPFERASLEDRPRRLIEAEVLNNGNINLTIRFPLQNGTIGDIWALQSDEPLVEWTTEANTDDGADTKSESGTSIEELWAKCSQTDKHRLCYDGFYSATPASYSPTSDDMFFRNSGAWLVNIFVRGEGSSQAFDELGFAMCDMLIGLQNGRGFWETEPQSDWLMNDYGIGPGFYDTRFNNDFTQTLFDAAALYDDKRFEEAAYRQVDFLVWLAENRHYEFISPDGTSLGRTSSNSTPPDGTSFDSTVMNETGWLVEDYYWPYGEHEKVHCSLNHQLQEMKALYMAYEVTHDLRYLETADNMLRGIKFTRDMWIKEDGSLEYAYMPDGSMGRVDYPYLTYNDLFEVQQILTRIGRERDPDLQILMDSKRASMDRSGLTDYLK